MFSTPRFADRTEAGERLAQIIQSEMLSLEVEPIVYGLPRGGVIVAEPVARVLRCPLDIVVAKKITQPSNPELAIGAVTADGVVIWAEDAIQGRASGTPPGESLSIALNQAREKATDQLTQLAPGRPTLSAAGKIAIVVDDGIATGMTMAVAVRALRSQQVAQVWIAAPVAPPELIPLLEEWGDRVILLATPSPFNNVSRFYHQFPQVETEAALTCLYRQNGFKFTND